MRGDLGILRRRLLCLLLKAGSEACTVHARKVAGTLIGERPAPQLEGSRSHSRSLLMPSRWCMPIRVAIDLSQLRCRLSMRSIVTVQRIAAVQYTHDRPTGKVPALALSLAAVGSWLVDRVIASCGMYHQVALDAVHLAVNGALKVCGLAGGFSEVWQALPCLEELHVNIRLAPSPSACLHTYYR